MGGMGEGLGDHDVGLGLAVVGVADGSKEEVGSLGVQGVKRMRRLKGREGRGGDIDRQGG